MTYYTAGDEPLSADGIHDEPADTSESDALNALVRRIKGVGPALIKHMLAEVLYAVAGISIGGVEPFAGLANWADDLEQQAQDAYNGAQDAQDTANYAAATLIGLTVTDVSGGVSLTASFSGAAATNIGASFTQVYSGPGGGTWGLDGDGNTIWNKSGGQARLCMARYNTPLATNYQQSRAVVTSAPSAPNFGSAPANYLICRANSACDTYVYAKISNNAVALGYAISGTQHDLDSTSFTLKPGDTINLYAGTDNDDRELIFKRNDDFQFSVIDSSAASSMGSSNLYVGLGCRAADANSFTDQRSPGKVTAWGGVDRQATTY